MIQTMHVKRMDSKSRVLKELQVVMTRNNDFHGVKCFEWRIPLMS